MGQLLKRRTGRTATRANFSRVEPALDHAIGTSASRCTSRVFEVLLGAAACLALIGVVQASAEPPADSPDAEPPAIFVQTD